MFILINALVPGTNGKIAPPTNMQPTDAIRNIGALVQLSKSNMPPAAVNKTLPIVASDINTPTIPA